MVEDDAAHNIRIERPVYEHSQLRQEYNYEKNSKNFIKENCNCNEANPKQWLRAMIPAIGWLSRYKWKRDILSDITSGFTVAVMHIPQGMAYALLGNVHPVVGIYMAVFPVIVYFFLGSSRHNSMGTFAVVCLMTGKAVLEHSDPSFFHRSIEYNFTLQNPQIESLDVMYTPIEVATAVTFTVALFQLAMYILRLGSVSALLSETLVSGFTTGAAVHVLVSQLKDLFGLQIPRHKGYFSVLNTFRSIFQEISNTNYACIIISSITICLTALNNEVIKPIVAKKTRIPIPIELIAVVVGTLASKYFYLSEEYNIAVVGDIPKGLPIPTVPHMELIGSVILDGFSIAVVSYTITLSMALIFAQKMNYEVDPNQELLAQGAGNIIGSFFSCMPFTASLSRSLIQQTVGGKTQIASAVSCLILLSILLWIGPFFEPLPKSVLSGVIVVALKGMLMQVSQFFRFLKLSKMDAVVWITTFLIVVFVGIDIGLLAGVTTSLATIFILGFKPYTCLLGSVSHTDLYLDISKYKKATQISGIKIFHYSGGINFATRGTFRADLHRLVNIDPEKEVIYRKKLAKYTDVNTTTEKSDANKMEKLKRKVNVDLRCLILDFSSVSYIDPSGVSMLKLEAESFKKIDIPIYISGCSEPVYEMLFKCHLIDSKTAVVRLFATVHDAVHCACAIFNLNTDMSISCFRL